jgi:hypothetical protein
MTTNYAGKRIWNATCRSWCTGHDGGDAEVVPGHNGPIWPEVLADGRPDVRHLGYSVSVYPRMNAEGVVYAAIDSEREPELTPGQAREVARQLLDAADWIEAHRDDPVRSSATA